MRPLVALLALASLASAAPVPKAPKKVDDKAALVGTWKVTLLNGKAENLHTHTYMFDADGGVRTLFGTNGTSDWTWAIEPDESPKRMKWKSKEGAAGFDCIYELDGDTLKLGFLTSGQAPPAKVEVTPGVTLYEMKREPAAK